MDVEEEIDLNNNNNNNNKETDHMKKKTQNIPFGAFGM